MTLSILCVTRGEDHAWPFLRALVDLQAALAEHAGGRPEVVLACDGPRAVAAVRDRPELQTAFLQGMARIVEVHGAGYIESVLDEAIGVCRGDYVLRLDDDERCSPAMVRWLVAGAYAAAPSWAFATAGLWRDTASVLVTPELWPQYHTRLSRRALAGGQRRIHQPNPHGRGAIAPVVLEHHKFLVKSLEMRRGIAARYEAIRRGAGRRCHSVPELVYEVLPLAPLGDGTLRTWAPNEIHPIRPEVAA